MSRKLLPMSRNRRSIDSRHLILHKNRSRIRRSSSRPLPNMKQRSYQSALYSSDTMRRILFFRLSSWDPLYGLRSPGQIMQRSDSIRLSSRVNSRNTSDLILLSICVSTIIEWKRIMFETSKRSKTGGRSGVMMVSILRLVEKVQNLSPTQIRSMIHWEVQNPNISLWSLYNHWISSSSSSQSWRYLSVSSFRWSSGESIVCSIESRSSSMWDWDSSISYKISIRSRWWLSINFSGSSFVPWWQRYQQQYAVIRMEFLCMEFHFFHPMRTRVFVPVTGEISLPRLFIVRFLDSEKVRYWSHCRQGSSHSSQKNGVNSPFR